MSQQQVFFKRQINPYWKLFLKLRSENFQRFSDLIKMKASFIECIYYFEGHCLENSLPFIKNKFLLHLSLTLKYKSHKVPIFFKIEFHFFHLNPYFSNFILFFKSLTLYIAMSLWCI